MYIRQHPYGMRIDLLGYAYKYCNLKVDYLAEKEGFVCIFCKAGNYGVAAVETGGNQLSTGQLNLIFKSSFLPYKNNP